MPGALYLPRPARCRYCVLMDSRTPPPAPPPGMGELVERLESAVRQAYRLLAENGGCPPAAYALLAAADHTYAAYRHLHTTTPGRPAARPGDTTQTVAES